MNPADRMRTYRADTACSFRFSRAEWGIFSNFCPLPSPIAAAGRVWPTSEHLYQAAKFSRNSAVQGLIANAPSAREAARLGRDPGHPIDPNWTARRVDAMRWVLRVKREANRSLVDAELARTDNRPIVEFSTRDTFWGAGPRDDYLVGMNRLGRLWMELRRQLRDGDDASRSDAWPNPLAP